MFLKELFSISKYRFLLQQLVKREFKIRYRGSFLGVIWSVLNPLLNMIVLSIVFSQVFRAVDNYKMYLLSGLVMFNFFSEATNNGLISIVQNFGLITKVSFPSFLLPFSKVITALINLLISIGVYFILGSLMGAKVGIGVLTLFLLIPCIVLFASGISFILSTLQVFFRDTQHLYGVVLLIWMYSTPILYPIDALPANLIIYFEKNPLYIFIKIFRDVAMYGKFPLQADIIYIFLISVLTFLIGGFIFNINKKKFIFYN